MIELTIDSSGGVVTRQWIIPPSVYLDHWAVMNIASEHQDHFVEALLRRDGTLCLSAINFLELSMVSKTTLDPVRALFRRVFPNVVFMDPEGGSVIAKEDRFLTDPRTRGRVSPPLHAEWLDLFFSIGRKRSLNPLDPDEFMDALHSDAVRTSLRETSEESDREMVEIIRDARERVRALPELKRRLMKPLPVFRGEVHIPPTRFVYIEALNHLVRGNKNVVGSDFRDLRHTVVPISYCDYVVLDNYWTDAALQIQRKLRKRHLLTLEGSVFSKLPKFLWHFENELTYRAPSRSGRDH